jgi:ribulose-5-phosphate 4-epimerase/fuculose-1-phosphate aldolase
VARASNDIISLTMPKRTPALAADASLIEDLVAANRILAMHGVLDAYGHVSARSREDPGRFLLSRSLAPSLVTAADIQEYGADSEPIGDTRKAYLERYIHGEIYRTRADVMAIVHSHSDSVIPFGISRTALRPVYHMASFLWSGVPVFDIRRVREENDLLIRDRPLGKALARSLGKCNCVLMRGHGMTVVGENVPEVVFRTVYTEMNAKLQMNAARLEGPLTFLSAEEGRRATDSNRPTIERPWELWKRKALSEK